MNVGIWRGIITAIISMETKLPTVMQKIATVITIQSVKLTLNGKIYILSIYLYLINMEKYVFCNLAGQTEWDVHLYGCADIQRGLTIGAGNHNMSHGRKIARIYSDSYVVEAETVDEAISGEIEDLNSDFGEGSWKENSFHVMPCAKKQRSE